MSKEKRKGSNTWVVTGFELRKSVDDGSGYDAPSSTRSESTLSRNEAGAGRENISQDESLLKGSEPLFIASGEQYGFAELPVDKTRTGTTNATGKSDRKDSTGTFKIPAASHKEAEPQSETRGALPNMLCAILKVKAGARRIDGLSSQPGEGLAPHHPAPASTRLIDNDNATWPLSPSIDQVS